MRASLLLLGPVVLGGVFSLVRLTTETFDVPRDADYAALRDHLAKEVGARDAVAALPAWSLRVHAAARDHAIVSGDALHARPLDRWSRLFVVEEPDGEGAFDALVAARGAPASTTPLGRLRVHRFDLPARELTLDLAAHLDRAEVRLLGKSEVRCDQRQRYGWGCPGRPGWQRVTREPQIVSENADLVVWAHPPPKGEVLSLTWRDVPVGDRLALRAGFTREGADKARAPVDVELLIDGKRVAKLRRRPAFDFAAEVIELSPRPSATVELRISSRDNGSAHFAFDGYISRGGGAP